MMNPNNSLWKWEDLIRIQLNIAERWLNRGKISGDKFAKFFYYFSGFNALYFLWREIDGLKNEKGERPNEPKQIEHLLKKFDEKQALETLETLSENVKYFCRRRPIQRMDRRKVRNPFEGDSDEGKKWQKWLKEKSLALDRLLAIGEILYLVRSNLVHGSKKESGDDEQIIDNSISPLEVFLTKSILVTKNKCPWEK
jgi:hypothetical protein